MRSGCAFGPSAGSVERHRYQSAPSQWPSEYSDKEQARAAMAIFSPRLQLSQSRWMSRKAPGRTRRIATLNVSVCMCPAPPRRSDDGQAKVNESFAKGDSGNLLMSIWYSMSFLQ